MSVTAREVLNQARIILLDEASERWPLAELLRWVNAGLREIATLKPSAYSVTVPLQLVAGTYQTIPAQYLAFLDAKRNLQSANATPRIGGPAITMTDRDSLDAVNPNWHDPAFKPYTKLVRHGIFDPETPREFYVYPGNDGTGVIEVAVARMPVEAVRPTPDNEISSYSFTLDLPDIYENALVDFVLSRAYAKDADFVGSGARATAHYQAFANGIGVKLANETRANPNTARAGRQQP